jgi:hypothetical protein
MALVPVFSQQVARGQSVNTAYQVSAGSLWFVQWGGIANTRFSQLGVHSLRSVDDLGLGFNCEWRSRILYSAISGFTYDLGDQIPFAIVWLYVSKACPIPNPVLTVYQIG